MAEYPVASSSTTNRFHAQPAVTRRLGIHNLHRNRSIIPWQTVYDICTTNARHRQYEVSLLVVSIRAMQLGDEDDWSIRNHTGG